MKSKTRKCLYCGDEFFLRHGNKKYCPDKQCDYLAKLDRQEGNYIIGNSAKAAIRKNHELFTLYASSEKKTELDLHKLLNKGFDQFGFYKYKAIDGVWYFYVQDYSFSINKNKITIWKS